MSGWPCLCWLAHGVVQYSPAAQAAMMASMDAVAQQAPGAAVQRAKLLWAVNEPHRAILQLQEVSASYPDQALMKVSAHAVHHLHEPEHLSARCASMASAWTMNDENAAWQAKVAEQLDA